MQVHAVNNGRPFGSEGGFTLVELMMVCVIVGTLGAMAMTISVRTMKASKADAAVSAAANTIEIARNRAIAERRNIQVHFDPPNRIRLYREESGAAPTDPPTLIADTILENDMIFKKYDDISDTPDEFGSLVAIDFDGPTPVSFTSDGSLVDDQGDPTNGTILFGARTSDTTESARAITLFGTTGLIQPWRWVGEWTGL